MGLHRESARLAASAERPCCSCGSHLQHLQREEGAVGGARPNGQKGAICVDAAAPLPPQSRARSRRERTPTTVVCAAPSLAGGRPQPKEAPSALWPLAEAVAEKEQPPRAALTGAAKQTQLSPPPRPRVLGHRQRKGALPARGQSTSPQPDRPQDTHCSAASPLRCSSAAAPRHKTEVAATKKRRGEGELELLLVAETPPCCQCGIRMQRAPEGHQTSSLSCALGGFSDPTA